MFARRILTVAMLANFTAGVATATNPHQFESGFNGFLRSIGLGHGHGYHTPPCYPPARYHYYHVYGGGPYSYYSPQLVDHGCHSCQIDATQGGPRYEDAAYPVDSAPMVSTPSAEASRPEAERLPVPIPAPSENGTTTLPSPSDGPTLGGHVIESSSSSTNYGYRSMSLQSWPEEQDMPTQGANQPRHLPANVVEGSNWRPLR